jgi:two-component system sensor histidine kinase/response regulator
MNPSARAPRVLVVDADVEAGERLAHRLAEQHFDVTTVQSAADTFDAVEAAVQAGHGFDLIFLDWLLPDIDGLETARRIRERLAADALPLPPVMLTSHALAMADSIVASLLRPFDAPAPAAAAPAGRAHHPAPPAGLAGSRVLLAEDNAMNQQVALALLEHVGVVADVAADGAAAVRLLQERHYDAVLMDMEMPVMDGIAAAAAIRALPGHEALPIIAMTANATPQDRDRCLAAGMNDHLAKPIEPDLLWQTLARWARPQARLPSGIVGLDVDEALTRLGGRATLYLSVLKMFVEGHAHSAVSIHAALDEGRRSDAVRLAHTLRGTAASIGARELSEAAAGLEVAIASQTPLAAIEPKLARLSERLDALVTALRGQLA